VHADPVCQGQGNSFAMVWLKIFDGVIGIIDPVRISVSASCVSLARSKTIENHIGDETDKEPMSHE
jgi:hypothetical protein